MKHVLSGILFWAMIIALPISAVNADDNKQIVKDVLESVPLIDGHNDLPWQCRSRFGNHLEEFTPHDTTENLSPAMHTDFPRLREGGVGGQFWSVYVPTRLEGGDAVQATLEQIDVVRRLVSKYPDTLQLATTAEDIVNIHKAGRIASLIGMEGGHSIGNSLAVLRQMYELGARYMTITHSANTDWADSATDSPAHNGLTAFGKAVIREMNRLGMIIDLSHVSAKTMHDTLDISEAPVIFSHSGAYGAKAHPRNVPDDVLERLREKDGVVMVIFLPGYLADEPHQWYANYKGKKAYFESYYRGNPEKIESEIAAWRENNPPPKTTIDDVIRHIDHLRDHAGINHIGIGSDYDGMGSAPVGLEDVSGYPALLEALLDRGYSKGDIAKIAGENVLRVMKKVELISADLKTSRSAEDATIEELDQQKTSEIKQ